MIQIICCAIVIITGTSIAECYAVLDCMGRRNDFPENQGWNRTLR